MDCVKIGKLIAKLRKEKNLTQKNIIDVLGIQNKTVSKWDCGLGCLDLNKVSEKNMQYAMLGFAFHNPVYYDNEIYMIPQGLGNKKDIKKVINLNKNDFEIIEFSLNNIALKELK